MEQTGIKKSVIEEIRGIAGKYNLTTVILFGSRARGDYGRASDIDLAVSGGDASGFALDVEEETSTPLKYDVVDLDGNVREELRRTILTVKKQNLTVFRKKITVFFERTFKGTDFRRL